MTDEIRQVVEALSGYGDHRSDCTHWRPWRIGQPACDCGFSDALALGRGLADGTSVKSPSDSLGTDAESPTIEEHEQLARDLDGADQAGLRMMDEIAELKAEAEQLRAILRDEPDGTPKRIIGGMFDAAEARGHSPYSARHALVFLLDRHDTLAATLADLRALLAPLWPVLERMADAFTASETIHRLPDHVTFAAIGTERFTAGEVRSVLFALPALRRLVEGEGP